VSAEEWTDYCRGKGRRGQGTQLWECVLIEALKLVLVIGADLDILEQRLILQEADDGILKLRVCGRGRTWHDQGDGTEMRPSEREWAAQGGVQQTCRSGCVPERQVEAQTLDCGMQLGCQTGPVEFLE